MAIDKKWRARVTALAAMSLIIMMSGACGGDDEPKAAPENATTAPPSLLKATEKEFSITFDQPSVRAGAVRVTVKNAGTIPHEFVAFRTDLPIDQFPIKNGEVDEEGAGITHIDPEAEDIAPGSSKTVTLHLTAGRYVFICNVPGHYAGGMHTELNVT